METNVFSTIFTIIIIVLEIAGMYKVFEKAGIPGWHAIIPILNIWDLGMVAFQSKQKSKTFLIVLCIAAVIFPIILIYHSIEVAKRFGKEVWFGILLFLFGFVCYPILGFGKSEYQA